MWWCNVKFNYSLSSYLGHPRWNKNSTTQHFKNNFSVKLNITSPGQLVFVFVATYKSERKILQNNMSWNKLLINN